MRESITKCDQCKKPILGRYFELEVLSSGNFDLHDSREGLRGGQLCSWKCLSAWSGAYADVEGLSAAS
jgi:hypothetical protein